MREPGHRVRRRVKVAIIALLGTVLAMLPATPAHAAGTLTLTSPNDGQAITMGSTHKVAWTSTEVTGSVKIELYDNGVLVDVDPVQNGVLRASTSARSGFFNWAVPVTLATSTQYTVRVTSLVDPLVFDESDIDFALVRPAVTVTSPKAPDDLKLGAKTTITWSLTSSGNVKLDLLRGGAFDRVIRSSAPASAGKFTWAIPVDLATGTNFAVRVTHLLSSDITANSPSDFQLSAPDITITAPAAAAEWGLGEKRNITWTAPFPGNVKIDLLDSGVFKSVIRASTPAAAGKFAWAIPMTLATSNNYTIRVTSVTNPLLTETMAAPFKVIATTLDVTAPAQDDVVVGGTKVQIKWSPNGTTANVKIDLLLNGVVVLPIRASTPAAAGKFDWAVPISLATSTVSDYTVRVTSLANGLIAATSDPFKIGLPAPAITLANTPWVLGTTNQITWNLKVPGSLRVELLDGGTFHSIIKAGVQAASGKYSWAIPLSLSTGNAYRVRITSLVNPLLTITSGTFSINKPNFTAATASTPWILGTTRAITWSPKLSGNVAIELLNDQGAVARTIVASTAASKGSYSWAMPLAVATGDNFKIRVRSLSNAVVTADTGVFDIDPPVFSASVASSVSFLAGSTAQITWSSIAGNVLIQLDTGGVLSTIKASTVGKAGAFSWAIPINMATLSNFKIRVTSLSNALITDDSGAPFAVTAPTITVTAPTTNQNQGNVVAVAWTTNLTGNVSVSLVGATTTVIRGSIPASSLGFSWTIPNGIADGTYVIRVTSIGRPTTTDDSVSFTI